jgi:hypothetical protein
METGLVALLSMLVIRVILPIVVMVGVSTLLSWWDARRAGV